jgi:hypothetical protein
LTLVRDRQTVLRGQLTELFMGEAHDYRMRMIIKRRGALSTEFFPVTSKRAATPRSVARRPVVDFDLLQQLDPSGSVRFYK